MIGTTEILVISGVVLLLFGSTALPKFARSLGKAKKELEKGMKEGMSEDDESNDKEEVLEKPKTITKSKKK
ncbi:MAG: twin-arginine translocase TatA/TatE family subunit [Spirochaetales bacterium]|nr:twin-arginine translocase TatA/TatE family subunit [Spirochaetales bacterium]